MRLPAEGWEGRPVYRQVSALAGFRRRTTDTERSTSIAGEWGCKDPTVGRDLGRINPD